MNKLSGRYIELAQRIEKMFFFFLNEQESKFRNEMKCRADGALYVASAIADMCLHAGWEWIHGWLVSNPPVGWLLVSNTTGQCWCGDRDELLPPLRRLKTGDKHDVFMFGHCKETKIKEENIHSAQRTSETWSRIWFIWLNVSVQKRLLSNLQHGQAPSREDASEMENKKKTWINDRIKDGNKSVVCFFLYLVLLVFKENSERGRKIIGFWRRFCHFMSNKSWSLKVDLGI